MVAAREAARAKVAYGRYWTPESLVEEVRRVTPRIGTWIDNSDQTPDETVAAILDALRRT